MLNVCLLGGACHQEAKEARLQVSVIIWPWWTLHDCCDSNRYFVVLAAKSWISFCCCQWNKLRQFASIWESVSVICVHSCSTVGCILPACAFRNDNTKLYWFSAAPFSDDRFSLFLTVIILELEQFLWQVFRLVVEVFTSSAYSSSSLSSSS